MFEGILAVPWLSFPQPEWNSPDDVPSALRLVASAASERESHAAYDDYLYAVGNNHSGSYYPVVVPTIPFLGEVLVEGGEWAKWTAVQALIDLTASFEPERGYERMTDANGTQVDVTAQLAAAAGGLGDSVRVLTNDGKLPLRLREAAAELLTHLASAAGTPPAEQG